MYCDLFNKCGDTAFLCLSYLTNKTKMTQCLAEKCCIQCFIKRNTVFDRQVWVVSYTVFLCLFVMFWEANRNSVHLTAGQG